MNSKEFVLTEARIWDGAEAFLEPLSSVLHVRDGRIVARGHEALAVDRGIPRLPRPGRFVVPGLIDAHVHLELDPALRTPAEQLAVAEATRRTEMAARAEAMLRAGITTARDCGGGAHREHALRAEIDTGARLGPRLLCCGQPVTTPGGHCSFWGGEVETRLEIESLVARQVEAGSDWIKVMATGGVFTPGSRARDTQFDLARLVSIVETAARAGRSVAAHCHGTEGIAHALRAGVRTIEHASFAGPDGFGTNLDDSLIKELGRSEIWISPTVNAGWGRRIETADGKKSDFFRRMSKSLRLQKEHAVRFIASTDAGIPGVRHEDLVGGLEAFARFAALRPDEVLRAATIESALALGLESETGRLVPGRSADFLVLTQNPLEDLANLRRIEEVVSRGRFVEQPAGVQDARPTD